MTNIIPARVFTNIDGVDTSMIKSFSCRPMVGDLVSVTKNGDRTSLKVVSITHSSEITKDGNIPILVVELNQGIL